MRLHPSTDTLGQYNDGELDPRGRARVAAHLADCHACRSKLQEWRAAAAVIREGPIPELPSDLFERIRSRRAEGERMILPATAPAPARPARWSALAIAAMIALLVIGSAVFFATPDLRADASELRLFPTEASVGAQIRAEYHASSLLSGNDRLVLRARFRTRGNDTFSPIGTHVIVADLAKGRDGVFRGSFRLPDSVVYAIFAVEDPEARRVDSNSRKGWDLLVHGADGRPLFEALEEKRNDLTGRNWEAAYETARTTAELYPERAQSWYSLSFFQRAVLGEAGMDSLRHAHGERFGRLHQSLTSQTEVSGDDAGGMFFFAWEVGDTVARDYWRDRLGREHPRHPMAVQNRIIFDLIRPMRWEQSARFVEEMDRMWEEIGPVHVHQGDHGFGAARDVGEPEAILRWADRYLHFRPQDARWVATKLAERPDLREEGMRRLHVEIRRWTSMRPEDRGLFSTVEEQRRHSQHELRALYGVLGTALIASGQTGAGLDTLALAVAAGWDTRLFRQVADARLTAGDTSGAVELWARTAVDPATSAAFADSVRASIGNRFDEEHWRELTARARDAMRDEVLADATSKSVRGPIRLVDTEGTTHALSDLAGGQPTLAIFWSRGCGAAIEAAPEIERVAKRLTAQGVRVVTMIHEKPSSEFLAYLAEKGLSLPVYHDSRREAARAFNQWGTPQYFVLDETGRIRFEYTSLEAVERQVAALASEGMLRLPSEQLSNALPDR